MLIPLRVLIIEDFESDAELALTHLERAGFTVTSQRIETAEEMSSALNAAGWDIIISDYSLPTFSGPAALKILIDSGKDIPFIVVSGTITEETAIELMRSGAADYLMKDRLARLGPLVKRELNIAQVRKERKQAENALRQDELYLRTILQTTRDGFWMLDAAGRIIDANKACCDMTGYSMDELKQFGINDLDAVEDPTATAKHIQQVIANGSGIFETRHQRKDGSIFDVEISTTFVAEDGGRFICFSRDISERKQIEARLRMSEDKFSTAFRVSPDAININRLEDGMYLEINEGFKALTGFKDEDVIGKTSLEINIWDNPQDRKRLVQGLKEKGVVNNLEAPFRCMDGSIKICLMSARMIEINGEKCILSITRDITDRKLKDEEYTTFIQTSFDGFWAMDTSGRFLDVNDALCQMLGYSREEFLRMQVADIENVEKAEDVAAHIQKIIRTGSDHFPTSHRRKDGTLIDVEVSSQYVALGNRFYVFIHDNSESKRAEAQILQSREALNRQNSLLSALLNNLPIGIFMVEVPSGKPLVANETAHRLLGRGILPDATRENLGEVYEAYKMPSMVRYPPEEMPIILAMQGASAHVDDMLIVRPDNSRTLLEVTGLPVIDHEGKIWASLVSFRDITERKLAEAALRESEYFFKATQRVGFIGSYKTDFVSGVWESSEILDQIFGIDRSYVRSVQGWLDIVHPDDQGKMDRYLRDEVIARRTSFNIDYRIIRKSDGKIRWVHGLGETNFDPQGNILSMIGTIQDITERKQAEDKLNDQLEELRRWHAVTLGREKRILELKAEVNRLLQDAGQPIRYTSTQDTPEK
jgi:PAS domain S-box-containing protein